MAKAVIPRLQEMDKFYMGEASVQHAMERLVKVMEDSSIPVAIAGAMAVNFHGYVRQTSDIDILIRREDLARFKQEWLGRGWVDKFEGSKGFKDVVHNITIVALLVGDYPGDGKEKPVSFPAPECAMELSSEGIPYINLPTLLELKLATAMTTDHRPRDREDVIQLIRANSLPIDYAEKLDPYVADKFREQWHYAQINEDY